MANKSKLGSVSLYCIFSIVFAMLLIGISSAFSSLFNQNDMRTHIVSSGSALPSVIIDAGHGGEDGGAVGINGILEKDINLSIANILRDMLASRGINVIMTRTEDILLYDRNVDYKGRKKILDLSARLKIANENENCVFVSIHMNSFPEAKYSGLQVYYSKNSELSKALADSIQNTVKTHLQPDNSRLTKKADSSIFLLDRCDNPSVLVECGFLSNPNECAKLCSEDYRKKLSLAIIDGICSYITEVYS